MKELEQYSFGPYGPFVALKDHRAAMAEKDQEIAYLNSRVESLRKFTCELSHDKDNLMATAVRFAEDLYGMGKTKEGVELAYKFLKSPAVQAWRA